MSCDIKHWKIRRNSHLKLRTMTLLVWVSAVSENAATCQPNMQWLGALGRENQCGFTCLSPVFENERNTARCFFTSTTPSAYAKVPPRNARTGFLLSPPSPRSYAPVWGCGDKRVPINWVGSSPSASSSDLRAATGKIAWSPRCCISALEMIFNICESGLLNISCGLHTFANRFAYFVSA